MRRSRKVSSVTSPAIHLPSQPITHWRVLRISQRQRMVTDGRRCICCSDNTPTFSPQNHWQWRLNLFFSVKEPQFSASVLWMWHDGFYLCCLSHLGCPPHSTHTVCRLVNEARASWCSVFLIQVWLTAHMWMKGYTHALTCNWWRWRVTGVTVTIFKNYNIYFSVYNLFSCLRPLRFILFSFHKQDVL